MKPAPFEYLRARNLRSALDALDDPDAKVIAGGQSLLPMMALRLARPSVLVDLADVPEMQGVEFGSDEIRIGAMTTQTEIEQDPRFRRSAPIVADTVPHIGHQAIRNRGTVGGALCHADPAAEWPALAILLDARIELVSSRGTRSVTAEDFFLGSFWSAADPGEVVLSVRFHPQHHRRTAMVEVARRRGDFALAGVMVALGSDPSLITEPRVVAFGVSTVPLRLARLESELAGHDPEGLDLVELVSTTLPAADELTSDIHGSGAYRRHLLASIVPEAVSAARRAA